MKQRQSTVAGELKTVLWAHEFTAGCHTDLMSANWKVCLSALSCEIYLNNNCEFALFVNQVAFLYIFALCVSSWRYLTWLICLFRMERGGDTVLRSRCHVFPKMPTFPDLDSTLDGECSQGDHQEDNDDRHITSNGQKLSLHLSHLKRTLTSCPSFLSLSLSLSASLFVHFLPVWLNTVMSWDDVLLRNSQCGSPAQRMTGFRSCTVEPTSVYWHRGVMVRVTLSSGRMAIDQSHDVSLRNVNIILKNEIKHISTKYFFHLLLLKGWSATTASCFCVVTSVS